MTEAKGAAVDSWDQTHESKSFAGQLVRDRRFSTRIQLPYHARLKGLDAAGRPFKEDALVDNLSNGGVHLRLTRSIPEGAYVAIAVRLSTVPAGDLPALRLAARGMVMRTEAYPDGIWGVAVEFRRRRVL